MSKEISLQQDGLVVCVSGPSGSGKSTLIAGLLERVANSYVSISQTTRKPRGQERHGVEYYFCERDEFLEMVKAGEILEYDEYLGNYYGTPATPIQNGINQGKNAILDITIAGAFKVKEKFPQACLVFVMPESMEKLRARLVDRATEADHLIEQRLAVAQQELAHLDQFDYILVNDQLDESIEKLVAIMVATACRTDHNQDFLNKFREPNDPDSHANKSHLSDEHS